MKSIILRNRRIPVITVLLGALLASTERPSIGQYVARIATFNVEDVRSEDVEIADHPRLSQIAAIIRKLDPDIILLNEIEADSTRTAQRFADVYLNRPGASKEYRAFIPASNTGRPSGFDLDRSGTAVTAPPTVPISTIEGPGTQTAEGRAYGNDSWGFGMFPGQYGMALLVSDDLEILTNQVRTFRTFRWSSMPEAMRPVDPESGEPWYDAQSWSAFPLSSKTHVDVPVRMPTGEVIHLLASHPTPPAFDGPEQRNKFRNHDEIRFWNYYLDDATFITDDSGAPGGLDRDAHFVIVGDLNADPDEGSSINDPVGSYLLAHPRVNGRYTPTADRPIDGLDPDDTAGWGLRVDYALPSKSLDVLRGGIYRYDESAEEPPSDHFPVWIDVRPAGGSRLCGGDDPSLIILGVGQDAGYPQAGTKSNPAFEDFSLRHFATSLAVFDPVDGSRWMFEATPDFKDQLHGIDTLMPRDDVPGLNGIFLTHAHIGHYAGLIHIGHEVIGADHVPVYAMPRMSDFLSNNGPWDQLVRYQNIGLRPLRADSTSVLNDRLRVTPFLVPHRDEYSETVGFVIEGPNRRVVFLPDINKWHLLDEQGRHIEDIVAESDVALLDATFYSTGEVGGRAMSEFPHPFVVETMDRFAGAAPEVRARLHFIHLNHTNPLLDPNSTERQEVLSRGFQIAEEGQCIGL